MLSDSYNALLEGIDAIHEHLRANEGRTTYGEAFFERLSDDLNLAKTLIYLMLRFRRGMPNVQTFAHLTWSHYVQIIPLETQQQREFYERAASHESWSVRQLKDQIKSDLFADARQIGSASVNEVIIQNGSFCTFIGRMMYTICCHGRLHNMFV